MYIHMCICIISVYTYMYISIMHVWMHTYIYIYIYITVTTWMLYLLCVSVFMWDLFCMKLYSGSPKKTERAAEKAWLLLLWLLLLLPLLCLMRRLVFVLIVVEVIVVVDVVVIVSAAGDAGLSMMLTENGHSGVNRKRGSYPTDAFVLSIPLARLDSFDTPFMHPWITHGVDAGWLKNRASTVMTSG